MVGAALLVCSLTAGPARAAGAGPAATASCPGLLQRDMPRLQDEKPQALCQYAGRVVLVVNTASFCGFTPQYKALEALSASYAERGLVVLGFPSNDFGSQEPGSNKEIAEFCENTFNVKFPMFAKSRVLPGKAGAVSTNPLFADLARRTGQAPQWNFHKYLISRDGQEVKSFASDVDPASKSFVQDVERLLAKP
jgi:glutathione peroxidase